LKSLIDTTDKAIAGDCKDEEFQKQMSDNKKNYDDAAKTLKCDEPTSCHIAALLKYVEDTKDANEAITKCTDPLKAKECQCPHLKSLIDTTDKAIAGDCKDEEFQKQMSDNKKNYDDAAKTLKCDGLAVFETVV